MGLLNIDKTKLVEPKVKTTPELVEQANMALFRAKMTLPAAAKHCGMTQKEMKMTLFQRLLKTLVFPLSNKIIKKVRDI